jgi:hypothetical protein
VLNLAQKKFINFVVDISPRSVEELRPDYHPRWLGEGTFREAFDVRIGRKSLGLVIKFPLFEGGSNLESIEHARDEISAIDCIRADSHLLALRRYMPDVLYFDQNNGVTVMPKYLPVYGTKKHVSIRVIAEFDGFVDAFDAMLNDLIPGMRYEFDSSVENFGVTKKREYILLDAGLLGALKAKR